MRIALISDLHGHLPEIPPCDLLIIAGDICPDKFPSRGYKWPDPQGQKDWMYDTFGPWAIKQPARQIAATWGNHDWVDDKWLASGGAKVIVDQCIEVGGLNIWFSPWSPLFGGWHWMKSPSELVDVYAKIPEGVDILVSHGPPYGCGDQLDEHYLVLGSRKDENSHAGSKELLATIQRVKPKLVVCGHIHSGYGEYAAGDTRVINASLVNEEYKPVHDIVLMDMEP